MKRLLIPMLAVAWLVGPPAYADFSRAALDAISAAPQANAQLPLDLKFTGGDGRAQTLGQALARHPAVVVFADYTCSTLCGPILAFAAAGLEKSGLTPGSDFHLIVIGLDPKDTAADAHTLISTHVGSGTPLAAATLTLSGDDAAVHAMAEAAGYRYAYDAEHDQFGHPAAAYVVTANGRIARVLSGLGLDGPDLRLALVEAGEGHVGTFADRIHLLCYGFDPARGIYTASISWWLSAGGAATIVLVAAGLSFLSLRARRRGLA